MFLKPLVTLERQLTNDDKNLKYSLSMCIFIFAKKYFYFSII